MIEPPVWPLAVLGAILGATCGSLIALHAGSKSDQWAWAFIAGLILAEYLTLVGLALYSGRSIPQAIVASAFSAPIVILVGIVGLLAILVVFSARHSQCRSLSSSLPSTYSPHCPSYWHGRPKLSPP